MKIILLFLFSVTSYVLYAQHELINPVCFNTDGNDYAVRVIKDRIFFISDVRDSTGKKQKDISTGNFFTDVYEAVDCSVNKAKVIKNSLGQDVSINSSWYDGPLSYSVRDSVLFLSMTNNGLEQGKMGIFLTRQTKSGSYTAPKPFPYNSNRYSCMHPFYDEKNSYLYFVSDMGKVNASSNVEFDLYRISYNGKVFGKIESLKTINTSYNELFPYVIDDRIYFSSDRPGGLGGLDIYQVDENGDSFPLSAPFNSEADDFAITFTKDNQGYFSSNRNKGKDEIYEFYVPKIDKKPLAKVEIESIMEEINTLLNNTIPGSPESTILNSVIDKLNSQDSIISEISNEMLANQERVMDFLDTSPDLSYDQKVMLYKQVIEKSVLFEEVLFAQLTNETQELVKINQEKNEEILEISEKEREIFEEKLKPFIEDSDSVLVGDFNELVTHYDINDSEVSTITGITYPMVFYYDFDFFQLSDEEMLQVRKFITVMKGYKGRIVVEGHTDAIGTTDYNYLLSTKRANDISEILISESFPKENIVVLPKGKAHPAATNFSAEGRALNRRVVLRLN